MTQVRDKENLSGTRVGPGDLRIEDLHRAIEVLRVDLAVQVHWGLLQLRDQAVGRPPGDREAHRCRGELVRLGEQPGVLHQIV